MTITALPTAPSTNDPANFATRADAWIAALATFVTEANALAIAMNLNSTTDTSASSVLIGLGEKTFTVSAGKSFQPGMFLIIADTSAPTTNSMYGQITSYSGTTLVMNMLAITDGTGSPTAPIAAWTISQSAGGGAYAGLAPLATIAAACSGNSATSTKSGIPQNSQSTAYTTVLADANKHILHPTADNNARTYTIDSNANVAYDIGTTITFVNQINTVTIAIASDTMTLAGIGTTGSRTLAAYGMATALKVSTTGWIISGSGLT